MIDCSEIIFSVVEKYGLFVIPLFSVDDHGICTCGKEDCTSPGKHPFFKQNWKSVATNNIDKIKFWKNKYRNLNFAVLTGKKISNGKYLVVIDIDIEKHPLVESLSNTFHYTTGNGYHFWYLSDNPVSNSVSSIGKHIDVRGTNGYVVIPPSKHVSGKKYKFLNDNIEIKEIPDLIFNKKNEHKKSNNSGSLSKENKYINSVKQIKEYISKGNKIEVGLRNNTIHRLLSSDRTKGYEFEELYNLAELYKKSCEEPDSLSINELRNIVYSVMKYPSYANLRIEKQNLELNDLDMKFFDLIKSTETIFCSLTDIVNWRNNFYVKNKAEYLVGKLSLQDISKILSDKGIKTKRLKFGNVWYCYLETTC